MPLTTVSPGLLDSNAQYNSFKNRIINGSMMIDQRNAGASVTPVDGSYTLDRWIARQSSASKFSVQRNSGSVTPPIGFINYLGVVSLSAYSVTSGDFFEIGQRVEGFNAADLNWGTANASPVTLSFWVRSSLTGTFGGSIRNSNATRSYPYSYTISSANTWEYKTVTIVGDTTGTWLTDNGIGIQVAFGLGVGSSNSGTANTWASTFFGAPTGATSVVGTNGATFYITGVQLEKGSTATSFDYRPYGTELALCQRYFIYPTWQSAAVYDVAYARNSMGGQFPVVMRAAPSLVVASGGMSGHHNIAPTAAGTNVFNANFDWTGSASRDGALGVVTFTASAEL